jgi:hypothetical protein
VDLLGREAGGDGKTLPARPGSLAPPHRRIAASGCGKQISKPEFIESSPVRIDIALSTRRRREIFAHRRLARWA